MNYQHVSASERIVECFCAKCGTKFDGLIQRLDVDGNWGPEVAKGLDAIGWVTVAGNVFCGRLHSDWYTYAMGVVKPQVVAVEAIADASYQKRMFPNKAAAVKKA